MLKFTVEPEWGGTLLKRFLRAHCGLSARRMASLKCVPGGICVNGEAVHVTRVLAAGDCVSLCLPSDKKLPVPLPIPLAVVYEDGDLLVVNKQAGLPMYSRPGLDESLCNAVGNYGEKTGEPFAFRPVYRIDKDTTGLVVVAKNAYAAARLAGQVQKEYYAVCEGELAGEGTVDAPIAVKPGHTVQREVSPLGKPAVTHWRCLGAGDGLSLLCCRLETGRTHQIRVHMASLGHPLSGDDFYGGGLERMERQALHCGSVHFMHPVTGGELSFTCPFPPDMQRLVDAINPQFDQSNPLLRRENQRIE